MSKRKHLLSLLIFCVAGCCHAARAGAVHPDFTFGNIKPEDFSMSSYSVDTSAGAVYIFDIGSTYFHEDASTHYEEVYQRRKRIKILNNNAFELATLIIPLGYDNTDEEKIENLQAATYNLVNGKVVAELIDKNSIFKEKMKGARIIKLTLPGVKEGSIIEFAYTKRIPGIEIPGWDFQGDYPVLWSEYEATIPYFYNYSVIKQGNLVFSVDSASTYHIDYSYHSYKPGEDNTLQHEWVMQNVPALTSEPYVNAMVNYAARLEFQLSAYKNIQGQYITNNQSWYGIAGRVLASTSFAAKSRDEKKAFYNEVQKAVGQADTSDLLFKVRLIYQYVRDHYTCNDFDNKYLTQEQKKTIDLKQGSVGDINLLLNTMLTCVNVSASPVLISTSKNGRINYSYPLLSKYNYIICLVVIDKKQYLLDASHKYLPFGKLTDECYNGYARIVDIANSQGIILSSNSLNETVNTDASIGKDTRYAVVRVSLSAQPSIEIKKEIASSGQKGYAGKVEELLINETSVNDVTVTGALEADSNISLSCHAPLNFGEEDVIYFSPLLTAQIKANPFAAANRKYTIELPYCKENNYKLSMQIPNGYEIEDIPQPYQLKLKEEAGLFNYAIEKEGNTIQVSVTVKVSQAVYEAEDYQALRAWYAAIIKKEAEQIVFKKIK